MTTLYLIRHGTTKLNEQLCFQGQCDEPLNEAGFAQGQCLYDYFKDIPIDLAVTSPLLRAKQTMELLLGDREVPVIEEDGIMELDGGEMEGRTFMESNAIFQGGLTEFLKKPGKMRMPGGEGGAEVYDRMVEAIQRIARENAGKTIVMTSHGFAIQCFLNYAEGIPAEEMHEQVLENVAVSKFSFDDAMQMTTDYVGDSHHLPEELKVNYDWGSLQDTPILFLHYPKCSTCKKAKRFLDDNGVTYLERDLVKEPLGQVALQSIQLLFDDAPRKLFNTSGMAYRQLGLKDIVPNMTPEDMAVWLASDGMLVKRPLLILPGKVLAGFKEEKWREALKAL